MRKPMMLGVAVASAFAIGAAPAQAQTIEPDNENFTALSGNTQLSYGGAILECSESNASGQVLANGTARLDSLTFGGVCTANIPGVTVDSVTTFGFPWTLRALTSTGGGSGTGQVEIPVITGGVAATVLTSGAVIGNCKIDVLDDQNGAVSLDGGGQVLTANASLAATAADDGGTCGLPATATSTFTGDYDITSTNDITIQP